MAWAYLSPFVAKAVQWAAWIAVFLFNVVATIYANHKAETILAALAGVAVWKVGSGVGTALVIATAAQSAYVGYKHGSK